MVVMKSFDYLKDTQDSISVKAQEILTKMNDGEFLPESLIEEAISLLADVNNRQRECLAEVFSITGEHLDKGITLKEIHNVIDNHYNLLVERKNVFDNFMTLYSDHEKINSELNTHKLILSSYTDEKIRELDYTEDVLPYSEFYQYAQEKDIGLIASGTEKMSIKFGDKLALALIQKKIHMEVNQRPAVHAETAESDAATQSNENDQASNMPGVILPEADTTEASECTVSEEENENGEIAFDADNIVDPDELATLFFDFTESGIELPENDSAFGILNTVTPKKKPNSSASFIRNLHEKKDREFYNYTSCMARLALAFGVVSKEFVKIIINKLQERINIITLEDVIDYLLREGFLCKYYIGTASRDVLYCMTKQGAGVLLKESCRKELFDNKTIDYHEADLSSAARFLRYKAIFDLLIIIEKTGGDLNTINFEEENSGYIYALYKFGDEPNDRNIIILPLIASREDDMAQFNLFIQYVLLKVQKDTGIAIIADTVQNAHRWQALFGDKLPITEDTNNRIVYFVLNGDKIFDQSGNEADFNEFRMIPETGLADDGNIIEPAEPQDKPVKAAASAEKENVGTSQEEKKTGSNQKAAKAVTEPGEQAASDAKEKISANPEDIGANAAPTEKAGERVNAGLEAAESSAAFAKRILDSNPDSCDAIDFIPVIEQLLKEDAVMEAVVLAKTAASSSKAPEHKITYDTLLMASNLSLDPHEYTSKSLSDLYRTGARKPPLGGDFLSFARIAAMAWALSFPTHSYNYPLYNDSDGILAVDLEKLPTDSAAVLKQFFKLLTGDFKDISFRLDGSGFSLSALNLLRSDAEKQQTRIGLQSRAREKTMVLRASLFKGFDTFMRETLGPASNIGKCMVYISRDKTDQIAYVRKTFNQFADSSENLSISEEKIAGFIDDQWEAIKKNNNFFHIKKIDYAAWNLANREITARLMIIASWLSLTETSIVGASDSEIEILKKIRNKIIKSIDNFISQAGNDQSGADLTALPTAGICLLRYALTRIKAALTSQQPTEDPWVYIPLLSSWHMHLTEDFRPYINIDMNEIRGLEPWRLMLRHVVSQKAEPLEALRQIEESKDCPWYEDYGTAILLNIYLEAVTGRPADNYESACRAAKIDLENAKSAFESSLRLACAYGQIDDDTKETLFSIVAAFRDHFHNTNNFAFFRTFLDLLKARVDAEKAERRADLEGQVRDLIKRERLSADTPMLSSFHEALKDENFALAQEYINRLGKGETEISLEEQMTEVESDFHELFVKRYPSYYKECDRGEYRKDSPRNWAYRALRSSKLEKSWSSYNENKTAERLLDNWISGRGDPLTASRIKGFLNGLGFTITDIQLNIDIYKDDQYEVYKATAVPLKSGLKDYAHPVFKYGTMQDKTMNVVCLYGCKGTSTLINIMTKKLQLNGPVIVLMDGILSLPERREIAEKFKAMTSGQNSFLLIDRVLLMFLASLNEGDRMVALLKCTLPYTFEQLYSKGVGAVPDEMFIGRIAERNDICNEMGPSLVYGGRQLGKTALLLRARSIQHQPTDKMYAIYIDIKDKGEEDLLEKLQKELEKINLIGEKYSSFDEICEKILRLYSAGSISRLQVFIDEADAFFEEAAKNRYATLNKYIQLMRSTNNKIKFIFAGLHNVAHTSKALEYNGLALQLGTPLCISPLSPSDARKLIERPLSYLGFKIGERQLALILAHTNYYPGLIHLFCYSLIQSVSDNYKKYYSAKTDNPPYLLTDDQLKAIYNDADMEKEIKNRIAATINNLDKRYKTIANIIADLYFEDKERGVSNFYGYDRKTIQEWMEIPYIVALDDADFNSLLDEMVNMGILWTKPSSGLYRLRQQKFLNIIGDHDEVETTLLYESGVDTK